MRGDTEKGWSDNYYPICKICGVEALKDNFGFPTKSNFCPNCGQQMFDIVLIKRMEITHEQED